MTSRIEYRFRCKKKSSYVTITSGYATLGRLRDMIMKQERLECQPDVTLIIQNSQTQKTYKDDNDFIYRSSSVIVSRLPTHLIQTPETKAAPTATAPGAPDDAKVDQAAPTILPILPQTDETEKEQQQFFFGESRFPRSFVFRPTRGHVILPYGEVACFQRTDEPPLSENRWNLDDLKRWLCPLCHRLLRKATSTPCCQTAYCDACITEAILSDEQNRCPNPSCLKTGISPSLLTEETQLREELKEWQRYDPSKLKGSEEYQRMASNRKQRDFGGEDLDEFEDDFNPYSRKKRDDGKRNDDRRGRRDDRDSHGRYDDRKNDNRRNDDRDRGRNDDRDRGRNDDRDRRKDDRDKGRSDDKDRRRMDDRGRNDDRDRNKPDDGRPPIDRERDRDRDRDRDRGRDRDRDRERERPRRGDDRDRSRSDEKPRRDVERDRRNDRDRTDRDRPRKDPHDDRDRRERDRRSESRYEDRPRKEERRDDHSDKGRRDKDHSRRRR